MLMVVGSFFVVQSFFCFFLLFNFNYFTFEDDTAVTNSCLDCKDENQLKNDSDKLP